MQFFHSLLESAALVIDGVASIIMIWGFVIAVFAFIKGSFVRFGADRIASLQIARCDLGVKLIFALELLIVSDLLHTVVSHSMDDLWFLAALVMIRTVIAFFLNQEIREMKEDMRG